MALAQGRPASHDGRTYEWVARQRGNTLRVVVQDSAERGQLLIVLLPVFNLCLSGEKCGDFYARTEVNPQSVGQWISEGLAAGWQPTVKRLPPFQVDLEAHPRREFPQPWGVAGISREVVEDLWFVLSVILRDPLWRQRLMGAFGAVHTLPPAYLEGIDPALAARLAGLGEVEVYLRPFDSFGDSDPCLAIKPRERWWPEVLRAASAWYKPESSGGKKNAQIL